ncbi:EscU/YscU/HrcU family type III secretion system export apparatus switch protein [Ruminococcaceae bacterium OttesenSCG-928-D13]|nr:EscU/YscU/HrcU family type III secretion system export apparatus switch protein [Ruminococcaceae bacterium OttesenSCG-928-D13]
MSKSERAERKGAGRNKAVALKYNMENQNAPVVIASGYGQIADRIIGIAEEKGIPVYKDDSAASMLCMLEVGRDIPPDLYQVVAAIYMQILQMSSSIKHAASDVGLQSGSLDAARALREQLQNLEGPGKDKG